MQSAPAVVGITSDKLKTRSEIDLAPRYYRDIGPSSPRLSRERLWSEHGVKGRRRRRRPEGATGSQDGSVEDVPHGF